jgi:exonuclease SbcD
MIRFLHLADLHLGAEPVYLGELAAERRSDFLNAFERAVDYALDEPNQVHAVLIAGDFFDAASPPSDVLSFAIAQLKRLKRAKIPVMLAPGNHDAIGMPGSVYAEGSSGLDGLAHIIRTPNVEHVETLSLNGEPVHIYGMAWEPRRSKPPFDRFQALEEEGWHIAVLHGSVEGAMFAELYDRDVPLKLQNLAKSGMDYIALGHIHSHQQHKAGDIPVVYPGTLEGRRLTAAEVGERTLAVVTLESGRKPKLELLPWNQRTLRIEALDLDAEAPESEDDLVRLISDRFSDPDTLLRLRLHGTADFMLDIDSIQRRLSGDFFWLEILDDTDFFDSRLVDAWAGEHTIRGLFVRRLQEQLEATEDEGERGELELALKLAAQALSKAAGG